jgi:enoyl-CoA hydratase
VSSPTSDPITLEVRDDGVARIYLDRPPVNALNEELMRRLAAVAAEVSANKDVWLAVLSARPGQGFCAGGDLSYLAHQSALGWNTAGREVIHAMMNAVAGIVVPTVAAVDKWALAGGFELMLCCDLVVATEDARFGVPEVTLGTFPGAGGTQRLPGVVGRTRAKDILFSGQPIDAAQAERFGLVNRLVPPGELERGVEDYIKHLSASSSTALVLMKRAMTYGGSLPLHQALEYEAEVCSLAFDTHDQKEGMNAFLEKRPPVFQRTRQV